MSPYERLLRSAARLVLCSFKAVDDVQRRSHAQPPFIAAGAFDGAKPGYFFKAGASGVGYYLDAADVSRAPW